MCSRCRLRDAAVLALAIAAAVTFAGCERERRDLDPHPAPAAAEGSTESALNPGSDAPPASRTAEGAAYEDNAYHINEGQRLFRWFNCNGCHGNGGGNIGPALMDDEWRYGGRIEQIHATIVQGRPNGMPSFRERIPDAQIWQIAAYVRSLSGNVPKSAAPSRGETIHATPPLTRTPAQPPKNSDAGANQEPQP
jgi:cytochrome c oxidase cbb3-type subunit 3